ncbi:MAG: ABC transporter ATP-binding protein [Gammaproteobacteria bacterium]|nr:ABC transporter ATP-binding protein [Gammaproteobacteria bacterium]
MATSDSPAVRLAGVEFAYAGGARVVEIDELEVAQGERLFVEGPSGSGKSTLLCLVAGILAPTAGTVHVLGESVSALGAAARDRFRAEKIGFVFQMFNLLPYLSLVDNVVLPCHFSRARAAVALQSSASLSDEADRLLERLGLGANALRRRRVTELSIGQQQRVAVARALIGRPPLVVADEPTSAMDAAARIAFVELLLEECAIAGSTVVFVSHDPSLATSFERAVSMAEINAAPMEGAWEEADAG